MPQLISHFAQGQHLLLESLHTLEPVTVQKVDSYGVVFERFLAGSVPYCPIPTMRELYQEQGVTWRCWDSLPTERKRAETPWKAFQETHPLGYNPYQE